MTKLNFRPYRRRFKPPLQTNHGVWDVRDGIIIRLTSDSNVGYGEIAPISWFGSETVEQALDFCRQLPKEISEEIIFSIPNRFPACQFGFESAWENFNCCRGVQMYAPTISLPYSALLPAGKAVLSTWQSLAKDDYSTFKWKIGVYPIAEELAIFHHLTEVLPEGVKLRLDANGGLSYEEANLWLYNCDNIMAAGTGVEIEYIEQPLGVEKLTEMQELSYYYATAIALDESVANLTQLETCYQQGWRGIFTIKPSIAGSPSRLRKFCQEHKIDAVFSSVFETIVGRQAALKLAAELSINYRAVGFGVHHWLEENEQTWLEQLWQAC
ncbi:MAG: L-Ala-D/L-Glu epimerase [Chroococcidiopsis sp. SAG 2025]|uniref:o-succinylbenzoate synthase n=1 Tax=Chroococcidiopsis sp. SAG 2025 TaxID=171389 RepID=UPI002936EBAE|nr:o-succinylbenzoate synthase [Chroococcidiopsis sp. SAG 2025]MDV2994265.1 L-Ala-D/L-Glu epimerase [Chroococcidiopsis sp. SAG 2025]